MAKKVKPTGDPAQDLLLLQGARLGALFEGNKRSSGRFDPAKERMFTEYDYVQQPEWEAHIKGTLGVGIVPIQDDDSCLWAALDLDNHDSDEDLPIHDVEEAITVKKLPLIACRSKSGGIHCYLFLDKPQPAAKIRIIMGGWAAMLGYGGSEIFPKQSRLTYGKDKQKALGNWINLPYMGGDETNRYAIHGGKKLTLDQFLDLAEKLKLSDVELRSYAKMEHPDAPPCVQRMYASGVASGHRNEALYNITVYHRKATPDAYEVKAAEANAAVFTKPLPRAEMLRTVGSAGRSDCQYRCNEEPIRSLCDRETCITRKFGITPADADRLSTVDALPVFSDLTKYRSEPVRWEFKIDGRKISNIGTTDLLDWRRMREIIANELTRIVPMIKGQEWERILHPLMSTARIIDTPDDASISGIIRSRLREFAAKADLRNRGEDNADRKALLRGLPVVQKYQGEKFVFFRGEDFVNYLKRTKSEELKGVNLWFAIKELGVVNVRTRIPGARDGENNINTWALPLKEVLRSGEQDAEPPSFKADL